MRFPLIKLVTILIVVGLFVVSASAQQDHTSLADVAKRKPSHKAARVVTNEDIPSQPDASWNAETEHQSVPIPSEEGKESTKGVTQTPAANNPSSVDREKAIQRELDALNKNLSDRQKRTDEYRQKMEQETDEFRRNTQADVLAAREAEEKRMIQRREELQQKLTAAKKKDDKQNSANTE